MYRCFRAWRSSRGAGAGVRDGTRQLTLAYAEEQARFDLDDVTTTARAEGDELILNGHKSMVANAATASQLVVVARTSGGQKDRGGITLVLVDADADGVKIESFPTVDGLRAAEVTFTDVRAPAANVLGGVGEGFPILNAVSNDGILALAAEAVGAMEILYKDTVAYTQEREQFDHPLSDFQVLQHRMVDMFVEYEQCKSLLYRATMEVASGAESAQRTVHALKHLVGKAGIAAALWDEGLGPEDRELAHFAARMRGVVDAAPHERRLALLRAHPELAGKLAVADGLTAESKSEQAGAGLDRCTPSEFARFTELNARYSDSFGHPFIIAVKGLDRAAILDAFERRIGNDAEIEFAAAVGQVHRIALLRLEALCD